MLTKKEVLSEHKLAIKLISQDEDLKKLAEIILKRGDVLFGLSPYKETIVWITKIRYRVLGPIRKNLYYTIFMNFDESKSSLIPHSKSGLLDFLAHEWAHIELKHLSKGISCGLCEEQCLKQELEANTVINNLLGRIGITLIRNKIFWKQTIIAIMKQCQEKDQKCLQTILNGNCPETESIKLYLKMIALDAKDGFLNKKIR